MYPASSRRQHDVGRNRPSVTAASSSVAARIGPRSRPRATARRRSVREGGIVIHDGDVVVSSSLLTLQLRNWNERYRAAGEWSGRPRFLLRTYWPGRPYAAAVTPRLRAAPAARRPSAGLSSNALRLAVVSPSCSASFRRPRSAARLTVQSRLSYRRSATTFVGPGFPARMARKSRRRRVQETGSPAMFACSTGPMSLSCPLAFSLSLMQRAPCHFPDRKTESTVFDELDDSLSSVPMSLSPDDRQHRARTIFAISLPPPRLIRRCRSALGAPDPFWRQSAGTADNLAGVRNS